MKADAVKLIDGPNNFKYVKTLKSKLFVPIELEDETYNKIMSKQQVLEFAAKQAKQPIIFYPKGSNTLMNFGPYTTVLNNKATQADFAEKMYAHMNKVLEKSPR